MTASLRYRIFLCGRHRALAASTDAVPYHLPPNNYTFGAPHALFGPGWAIDYIYMFFMYKYFIFFIFGL
jgi:hypothetical protein